MGGREEAPGTVVHFGGYGVSRGITHLEITTATNTDAKAKVTIETSALTSGSIDYRPMVRIESRSSGKPPTNLYKGWVTTAIVSDDGANIDMRNGVQMMERRFAGLSTSRIQAFELVWSLSRFGGLPPEDVKIQGFAPFPEQFEVSMPVRGLTIEEDLVVGRVTISAVDTAVKEGLNALTKLEAAGRDAFLEAGLWASVKVKAGTVFDAERAAVPLIEGTMDRLALEAQYSLAYAPDGTPRSFERDALFANPRPDGIALVHGLKTDRRWCHVLADLPHQPLMTSRRVTLKTPAPTDNPRFDEALRAWRRAVRETDRVAAVSALSEAIEFYAAGTSVPHLFTKAEISLIQDALAAVPLNEEQRTRLDGFAGSANEPPLMVRFRAALDRDKVAVTEEELAALRRLRSYRNNFVHGRAREEPTDEDLDLAKAFVNRMLAFRGAT